MYLLLLLYRSPQIFFSFLYPIMQTPTRWTRKDLDRKIEAGLIRGYTWPSDRAVRKKILKDKGKAYYWIGKNLWWWCQENAEVLNIEFRFHATRKWRFDFAIVSRKIAIEYEGIFTTGKSRHTTVTGYTGDTEKYNEASIAGWTVIRLTAMNYKKLHDHLNSIL